MDEVLYLNYSDLNGLYISSCEYTQSSIQSHMDKGYKAKLAIQKLSIENKGFEVVVKTNFGYASSSYHFAKITVAGSIVLDLRNKKNVHGLLLGSCGMFFVEPGNWDELFKKIIHVYENLFYLYSDKDVDDYFDEFDCFLNDNFLKDSVIKALRLKDIIDTVGKSICRNDSRVHRRLVESCKLFIAQIAQDIDVIREYPSDHRVYETLMSVNEYFYAHNCSLALFDAITSTKIEKCSL